MAQVTEKNIETQIQLWAVVGPFVTLLTLLVSMLKSTPMQTSFAVCLLVGVPLCWRWKLKGLAISMGLLLGVFAFHFMDLAISARFWSAGLGVSASLSFLITALSFDEVSALTDTLQIESRSRLDNLLKLDERLKLEKESYLKSHEHLQSHIKELEEQATCFKQLEKELRMTLIEREQELLLERQKIASIQTAIQEKEMVFQELLQEANSARAAIHAELEKATKKEASELRKVKGIHTQLQKQFKEKADVLDETRKALFHMQEKLLSSQRDLEEARKADKSISEALVEGAVEKMERERRELEENHQQEIDALHDIIASLSAGKAG